MSVVDWLQVVVPSGVMVLAAILVHMASRRADATQKASIDVELRKIEDDLRN